MNAYYNLIAWIAAARWRLSASHCIVAAPFFVLGWQALGAYTAGAWFVTVAFYVREWTQYQQRVKAPGASNITVWARGWTPFEWGAWSVTDWVLPSALYWALAHALPLWTR